MVALPGAGLLDRVRAAVRARFRLHDNWRQLVRHAWSVRFALAAALFDGLAMAAGFFTDAPERVRPWIAALGFSATLLAAVARLMPQAAIAPTTDAAGDA